MICPVVSRRAGSLRAVMSPNPTVLNTVIAKYNASVRDSGSLKLPGALCSIRKQAAAYSRTNSGTVIAMASMAFNPGRGDSVIW